MVIGAVALLKLGNILHNHLAVLVFQLGFLELIIATAIVFYVSLRYAAYYLWPST